MKRTLLIFAILVFVLAGVRAFAQAPAPGFPQTFTNLQVWPPNTSPATIQQFMNAFDDSLGITCEYCHVRRDGKFDFASDDKREKQVARRMILLRDSINVEMPAIVGKPAGAGPTSENGYPNAPVRVLCSSCHRGLPVPRTIADEVTAAEMAGGGAAGLARFKELREKFYGGQQYDLRETALIGIANRALNAKRSDDAIAYLRLNLTYFPKSATTYLALARAHEAKGDKAAADNDRAMAKQAGTN
jgi:hypothetical protein